ncbi:hypothetical protein AA0616_3179 [Komagataeibacter nataicola NRIC 0616]|nr:hypothetical protein AA0616_3179 [Komagataeibacter nataicola NRIC 0616]
MAGGNRLGMGCRCAKAGKAEAGGGYAGRVQGHDVSFRSGFSLVFLAFHAPLRCHAARSHGFER